MSLRENCNYLLHQTEYNVWVTQITDSQNDTQVKEIDKLNRHRWYRRVSDDKFVTYRAFERYESRYPEPLED